MYEDLYNAWKREKETSEIQTLSKDFYVKLSSYAKRISEESRMLDEKTVRARLHLRESQNVKRLAKELLVLRCQKIVRTMMIGRLLSKDCLTEEEKEIYRELEPSIESFHSLLQDVLAGRPVRLEPRKKIEKIVLRFLKDVPTIIGGDMKSYGPFKPEDVASLPVENAKILIRQALAIQIEMVF
jgi:DNA replication factor GINS